MDPSHLLLIDLSSIWHAAWHASADEELSAAFTKTVSRVHRYIQENDATYTAVCLDAPPYLHRLAIFPAYKAQREKPPAAMFEQFARVKARLVTDGLLLWSADGFEADDVIATATKAAVDVHSMRVTVVSADKDLLQLVNDDRGPVRVFSPASETYYDRAKVVEKFGVAPADMLDLLALMGDKSDNVPGVAGVGPKHAARLILTYGNFDEIFAHADNETAKMCESLITGAENARLARQVVALRSDVPIRFDDLFEERKALPIAKAPPPGAADGFDDEDEFKEMISTPSEPKPEPTPEPEPKATGPGIKSATHETALAVRDAEWTMQLEPRNGKQAWWLAERMADSRVFAKFGSPEVAYVVILRGRALGLDAMAAAAAFHRIGDTLAMHADLIEALVLRSGKAEFFELVESTTKRAVYATKRRGGRRVIDMTFTIEDAHAALLVERSEKGLDGYRGVSNSGKPSSWDKFRATMLRHRCKTQLARAVYSDVVLGLYTLDEVSDGKIVDAEIEAA